MGYYDRPASLPAAFGKLTRRVSMLERRTRGTYKTYDTTGTTIASGASPLLMRATFTCMADSVIELWAAVRLSHSAASNTTTITSTIDAGSSQQVLYFSNTGAVTRSTTPGDNTGGGSLPGLSGQPAGFIVIGYSVNPGEHTIDLRATRTGSGTATIAYQHYAIREA